MKLALKNISFTYPGSDSPLFRNLDWSLEGPGFFSVFGLSGAGKSTMAKLLTGDLVPQQGSVLHLNGHRVLYAHNTERFPGWNSVGVHLESVTPSSRMELLKKLVREYGIGEIVGHRFSGLSTGQKNRSNLTRYLVQDFDFLIADEVLANVDEPSRNRIIFSIKALFPHKTFLYISHNALEVARFSQTIYVLPQESGAGISRLAEIPGLDQHEGQEFNEALVQERVYAVLRIASSTEA